MYTQKLKMGDRKVQQTRYSFTVPLPPNWIRTMGIKKGDVVSIEMLEDQSIRIAAGNISQDQTDCNTAHPHGKCNND